jgi:hypothetical protein
MGGTTFWSKMYPMHIHWDTSLSLVWPYITQSFGGLAMKLAFLEDMKWQDFQDCYLHFFFWAGGEMTTITNSGFPAGIRILELELTEGSKPAEIDLTSLYFEPWEES